MEKLALIRAEEGEWAELVDLAENVPHSIMVPDEFGMLPLHWVCTESTVPLETLQTLLRVYPEACEMKNLSGMLPLHVAITSKLPGVHLNALVNAFPGSIYVKGGDSGLFPAEMARRCRLPDHSINVLKKSLSLSMSIRPPDGSMSIHRSESDSSLNRFPRSSSWESVDKLKPVGSSSSSGSTASSIYSALSSPKSISSRLDSLSEPDEIGAELRELSGQLAALHMEMRSSKNHVAETIHSVLWNPGDRLGVSLEPAVEAPHQAIGARVKRFTGESEALGIDVIQVGDHLLSVNGIDVTSVPFTTVCKFLKKTNVTCKLTFQTPPSSSSSTPSPPDVHTILQTALDKVQSVQDIVRLNSAMTA
ncbi:hypothetical protein AeMF1_020363 [Aphanomyces euteiches]|nr:hypothetical protein AeMF1_020363 [Aphanomyces euteiches]KAH9195291.1 hypothetical protein AeNC1_002743 [Aphanomyces euteiches]